MLLLVGGNSLFAIKDMYYHSFCRRKWNSGGHKCINHPLNFVKWRLFFFECVLCVAIKKHEQMIKIKTLNLKYIYYQLCSIILLPKFVCVIFLMKQKYFPIKHIWPFWLLRALNFSLFGHQCYLCPHFTSGINNTGGP